VSCKTIVVIGGTGHFGGRICRRLIGEPNTCLVVTSRSLKKAEAFASELRKIDSDYLVIAATLDHGTVSFEADLASLSPDIVIHTAGPYQGQSYRVVEACISVNAHYIDLADGREFVEQFSELDNRCKYAGVIAVTGASTLPGLSSAVVNHFSDELQNLRSIRMSIAPAHQTPRGISTVSAVLSYCGKPFSVLKDGSTTIEHGWHDLQWQYYPTLGKRLSAACDVPDLSMLPSYFIGVKTVTFHAAIEARWEQLGLWCMGWLSRIGLVKSWSKLVPFFNFISERTIKLGSDRGGMHIQISGTDDTGVSKEIDWYLTAENNHGPEIPCTPAIILARKLARCEVATTGAMPCLGLFDLDEFDHEVESLSISWRRVE